MAEMRKDHTLEAIGDVFGVSRERVRQILVQMGRIDEYQRPDKYCAACNVSFPYGTTHRHQRIDGRWTPEREMLYQDITADYLAGMRLREISKKYRTSNGTPMTYTHIYRIIRHEGYEPGRGGGSYVRDEEQHRRYQETIKSGGKREIRGWRADD